MSLRAERGALQVALLLLYAMLTLVPLLAGWLYSLAYSLGLAGAFSQGFTLANWERLLPGTPGGAELYQTLGYSFWLALASLAGVLLMALLISYAVLFSRRGRALYGWLFLPLTLPPVVAAFAAYLLLNPAGLARSLGCGRKGFFARVYAPLLLRRNLPLILLYGVYLLGTYEIPMLLGRSAPRSISVYITEQLTRFDTGNFALGHAAAVLYALLVALALFGLLRLRRQPISEQA